MTRVGARTRAMELLRRRRTRVRRMVLVSAELGVQPCSTPTRPSAGAVCMTRAALACGLIRSLPWRLASCSALSLAEARGGQPPRALHLATHARRRRMVWPFAESETMRYCCFARVRWRARGAVGVVRSGAARGRGSRAGAGASRTDQARPRVRPSRTQNRRPAGIVRRASSQGCMCSKPRTSMPISRRRPPLPRRTSADPRRRSESSSVSDRASWMRGPTRSRITINART